MNAILKTLKRSFFPWKWINFIEISDSRLFCHPVRAYLVIRERRNKFWMYRDVKLSSFWTWFTNANIINFVAYSQDKAMQKNFEFDLQNDNGCKMIAILSWHPEPGGRTRQIRQLWEVSNYKRAYYVIIFLM